MTSFCCISDLHNKYRKLKMPEADHLLIAGDFSNSGSQFEYEKFFEWVDEQQERYSSVIFIAGNHDGSNRADNKRWIEETFPNHPGIYLEDSFVEIDGFKIYGMPWSVVYYDWSYMLEGQALKDKSDAIPDDVDILISHGPPFMCGDMNGRGENCGDGFLADRVKKLENLKLHCFGHIHPAAGSYTFGNSRAIFANVAMCDDRPVIVRDPVVFDLKK